MAVRQANGSERQPVLLDRAEYGLGMVAGVDEDSLTGGRVVVEIPLDSITADVAVDRDDVLDRVRDGMARMPPVTGDGGQLGAVEAECCRERVDLRRGRRALARFKLTQRRRAQSGVPGNLVGIQPQAGARLLDDVAELVFQHGFGSNRSEEHTSELQSRLHLVCRLLLEKKKKRTHSDTKSVSKDVDQNVPN